MDLEDETENSLDPAEDKFSSDNVFQCSHCEFVASKLVHLKKHKRKVHKVN